MSVNGEGGEVFIKGGEDDTYRDQLTRGNFECVQGLRIRTVVYEL